MGPIRNAASLIDRLIAQNKVVIFSKTTCPFCVKIKDFFRSNQVSFHAVELDKIGLLGREVQAQLQNRTGQATVPNVWVGGCHIGGCDDTLAAAKDKGLLDTIKGLKDVFDYDVLVIGGGSGGLAAAKEAARLGKRVALCDFVRPSPMNTSWGLGGTCVNVGCIPKKLMHQAAILGEAVKHDAREFGWEYDQKVSHSWSKMVEQVQNYIGSLNWNYRVQLRSTKVDYLNEYASFLKPHTIQTVNKKGLSKTITAANVILATGGRPKYPSFPGAKEFCITSDDLFSLKQAPGKTLLVGASYISLECAGFLHGLGYDVTVMVRSIFLRGFDQQMAEMIGTYMTGQGIQMVRPCVPTSVQLEKEGVPGTLRVKGTFDDGREFDDIFNTVILAVGRDAETSQLGLDQIGVKLNPSNGKVLVNEREETSAEDVYAIGDIIDGKPELTPVAIQAGKNLARRICGQSDVLTNYDNVPTTVFTPLEYGCCGLSEEEAAARHGDDQIEVYHSNFVPLEWAVAHKPENACYAKLIVRKSDQLVLGFHYLGPNAGEVTQGFGGMLALKATKDDFDNNLIGIHPTCAEVFTTMEITKSSGVDPSAKGC